MPETIQFRSSSIARREYVPPARRHKCEKCLEIFECHLCTINKSHELHSLTILGAEVHFDTKLLLCEDCVCSKERNLALLDRVDASRYTTALYDYSTGKRKETTNDIPAFIRLLRMIKMKKLAVYRFSSETLLDADLILGLLDEQRKLSWSERDFVLGR